MPCLAVTNLAKEFDLHSRFGSVVVVVVLVERLANNVEFLDLNVGTTPPLKFYLMIFIASTNKLVLNCARRQIGDQNGGFNLTLQLLVWDILR